MRKRMKVQTDDPQANLAIEVPTISLRERLEQQSKPPMPAIRAEMPEAPVMPDAREEAPPPIVSAETLETLSRLHASLNETAEEIARKLEQTAERMAIRLHEAAVEISCQGEVQTSDSTRRLAELQRSLGETERNLAYTVERLRRENGRAGRMQTGVIALALLAGTLGGTAASLLILVWMH
jgi:hypothetical protein